MGGRQSLERLKFHIHPSALERLTVVRDGPGIQYPEAAVEPAEGRTAFFR